MRSAYCKCAAFHRCEPLSQALLCLRTTREQRALTRRAQHARTLHDVQVRETATRVAPHASRIVQNTHSPRRLHAPSHPSRRVHTVSTARRVSWKKETSTDPVTPAYSPLYTAKSTRSPAPNTARGQSATVPLTHLPYPSLIYRTPHSSTVPCTAHSTKTARSASRVKSAAQSPSSRFGVKQAQSPRPETR